MDLNLSSPAASGSSDGSTTSDSTATTATSSVAEGPGFVSGVSEASAEGALNGSEATGEGGEGSALKGSFDGWKSLLESQFTSDPTIAALPDTPEGLKQLGKMMVHAQRMIGKEKIPLPGKNASAEDWENVYTRLGRPALPTEYGLDAIEVPRSFLAPDDPAQADTMSKATAETFSKIFHEAGLNKAQAEKVYKAFADNVGGMNEAINKKITEEVEANNQRVIQEWGKEGSPEFERNRALASRAFERFANPDDVEYLTNSGQIYDPVLSLMFARIGNEMAEDTTTNPANRGSIMSGVDQAKQKLDAIMNDRNHAFYNRGLGHDAAVAEVKRLNEIIYGAGRAPSR